MALFVEFTQDTADIRGTEIPTTVSPEMPREELMEHPSIYLFPSVTGDLNELMKLAEEIHTFDRANGIKRSILLYNGRPLTASSPIHDVKDQVIKIADEISGLRARKRRLNKLLPPVFLGGFSLGTAILDLVAAELNDEPFVPKYLFAIDGATAIRAKTYVEDISHDSKIPECIMIVNYLAKRYQLTPYRNSDTILSELKNSTFSECIDSISKSIIKQTKIKPGDSRVRNFLRDVDVVKKNLTTIPISANQISMTHVVSLLIDTTQQKYGEDCGWSDSVTVDGKEEKIYNSHTSIEDYGWDDVPLSLKQAEERAEEKENYSKLRKTTQHTDLLSGNNAKIIAKSMHRALKTIVKHELSPESIAKRLDASSTHSKLAASSYQRPQCTAPSSTETETTPRLKLSRSCGNLMYPSASPSVLFKYKPEEQSASSGKAYSPTP